MLQFRLGAAKQNNKYFLKTSVAENNIILDNLFLQTMLANKRLVT